MKLHTHRAPTRTELFLRSAAEQKSGSGRRKKAPKNNSANGSKMARLLRSSQGQKNCPKIGAVVKLKNRVF
jgi:hypothetical protein